MASRKPVHGADELQTLEEESQLSEATSKDILTLLKREKLAHKQIPEEHLRLQQKYNSVTARAEAGIKGKRELLFRLSNVEEELPKFNVALVHYKEESRQLHDENSRLSQELEHRRAKSEALSLQLKDHP
ncbi:hypothetical protein ABBQ38_005066 [Trebouxia sp. C0009 RCD-2024]